MDKKVKERLEKLKQIDRLFDNSFDAVMKTVLDNSVKRELEQRLEQLPKEQYNIVKEILDRSDLKKDKTLSIKVMAFFCDFFSQKENGEFVKRDCESFTMIIHESLNYDIENIFLPWLSMHAKHAATCWKGVLNVVRCCGTSPEPQKCAKTVFSWLAFQDKESIDWMVFSEIVCDAAKKHKIREVFGNPSQLNIKYDVTQKKISPNTDACLALLRRGIPIVKKRIEEELDKK